MLPSIEQYIISYYYSYNELAMPHISRCILELSCHKHNCLLSNAKHAVGINRDTLSDNICSVIVLAVEFTPESIEWSGSKLT